MANESRPTRWSNACSNIIGAIEETERVIEEAKTTYESMANQPTPLGDVLNLLSDAEDKLGEAVDAASDLQSVKEEYSEWYSNIQGTNLENGPTGEKLQEIDNLDIDFISSEIDGAVQKITELRLALESKEKGEANEMTEDDIEADFDNIISFLDSAKSSVEDAESVDLPRGFGRD